MNNSSKICYVIGRVSKSNMVRMLSKLTDELPNVRDYSLVD